MAYRIVDTLVPGSANKFPVVDVVNVSIKDQYLGAYLDNLNGTITNLSTAVEDLRKRIVALENGTVAALDKTKINSLITQANSLKEEDYTTDSWDSLEVAYAAAELARDTATTQGQLDEASADLEQAIKNLIYRIIFTVGGMQYTAEPNMTWYAWANSEDYNTSANPTIICTSTSNYVFYGELRILSGTSYIIGSQAITDNGTYVIETVEEVDKTALLATITEVERQLEGEVSEDYTSGSWTTLQTALTDAKTVYNTSTSQRDVDSAKQTLETAYENLVYIASLAAVISEANELSEPDYSEPSWEVLENAKTTAEQVLANADATKSVVDNATTTLQEAINALLDISKLLAAITNSYNYKSEDYTTASYENLETARGNAESVRDRANSGLDNETQTTVDDATQALEDAITNLVPIEDTLIQFSVIDDSGTTSKTGETTVGTTWSEFLSAADGWDSYSIDAETNRVIPAGGYHLIDTSGNIVLGTSVIEAITYYWEADSSEEPDGIIETIIANETPLYQITTAGELEVVDYEYITYDETTAAKVDGKTGFYQITDDSGNIIESGYQHSTTQKNMYYVVALPESLIIGSGGNITLQNWDYGNNVWASADYSVLTNNQEEIRVAFEDAGLEEPVAPVDYTLWADLSLADPGTDYRFIINE